MNRVIEKMITGTFHCIVAFVTGTFVFMGCYPVVVFILQSFLSPFSNFGQFGFQVLACWAIGVFSGCVSSFSISFIGVRFSLFLYAIMITLLLLVNNEGNFDNMLRYDNLGFLLCCILHLGLIYLAIGLSRISWNQNDLTGKKKVPGKEEDAAH